MERKKTGLLLLLLLALCLVTVGCDKKEETKEEEKKEEKKEEVKERTYENATVLKCTGTEEDEGSGTVTIEIAQDKDSYELVDGYFSMVYDYTKFFEGDDVKDDIDFWKDSAYKGACEDDNNSYKTCKAEWTGSNGQTLKMEAQLNPENYLEDVLDGKKPDKDTLTKLKTDAEKDGYKCTIS